ncbi:hypothetical protein F5Y13DRAFT_202229 [Hypoxylon sp. FL1857]|nr:hypothetical protein F5Y13DRAFT_202229 [Hypoxylon sp. FL1857]
MSESFQIIDAFMRLPTDPFYYRILTGSSIIKYLIAVTPPPGITIPDICGECLGFQNIVCGDWNVGNLRLTDDGCFVLESTKKEHLPDVCTPWHHSKIDFLDLPDQIPGSTMEGELQCRNQLVARVVSPPSQLGDYRAAIAFWLWQPPLSEGLGPESSIYAMIEGYDIGPKFLAHITENRTRIIGFMVEGLQARIAGVSDIDKCKAVLSKLHCLGIAYGNLRRDSFLVDDSLGRAYLHDFANSYMTTDLGVLGCELAGVEDILKQPSGASLALYRWKL